MKDAEEVPWPGTVGEVGRGIRYKYLRGTPEDPKSNGRIGPWCLLLTFEGYSTQQASEQGKRKTTKN